MKVERLEVRAYDVPMREVKTSQGVFGRRRGVLLRALDSEGRVGWGEAARWPGFGSEASTFAAGLDALSGASWGRCADTQDVLEVSGRFGAPELVSGVEGALLDLLSQRAGQSLSAYVAPRAESVSVHKLVFDEDDAAQARRGGFETVKVKVGAERIADDDERLRRIRAAIGPDVALRLDANGAWGRDEAARALERFEQHGLDFVEEPLAAGDHDGLSWLCGATAVPLAVDESLTDAESLRAAVAAGASVAVFKPMFLGGFLRTRALASEAASAGIRVLVTHALEGAVGRLGALHLAATIPGILACGLAGQPPSALGQMPAAVRGRLKVPDAAGLGLDGEVVW